MASERAKADEENLRQTAFEKGEWANQPPTDLDVDYDLLSGALGTAGAPLMSITAETFLALSFCVDELAQALSGKKIDDILTRWGRLRPLLESCVPFRSTTSSPASL